MFDDMAVRHGRAELKTINQSIRQPSNQKTRGSQGERALFTAPKAPRLPPEEKHNVLCCFDQFLRLLLVLCCCGLFLLLCWWKLF